MTTLPEHVAFILDGNGRWAEQRGLSRLEGHRAGVKNIRPIIKGLYSKGIKYVYTGNVRDSKSGSTFCPDCGELLIERDWYQLGAYNLKKDKCGKCGYSIAGRFDD